MSSKAMSRQQNVIFKDRNCFENNIYFLVFPPGDLRVSSTRNWSRYQFLLKRTDRATELNVFFYNSQIQIFKETLRLHGSIFPRGPENCKKNTK